MSFTITTDGDYSTPVLMSRMPKSAGFEAINHYIWVETFAVNKSAYYPLKPGDPHPDNKEDPYDIALTSFDGTIFDLTSGGKGQPIYLISEEVLSRRGNLAFFKREWSAIPPDWTEAEYGYYTFPGYKYFTTVYEKPQNLPVLIENQYSYALGQLNTLSSYDTKNYKITVKPSGTPVEVNWIEYYGRYNDESGQYVEAESILSKKTGDAPYVWPADINDNPTIEVKVSRWKGDIYEIKTSKVKYKL